MTVPYLDRDGQLAHIASIAPDEVVRHSIEIWISGLLVRRHNRASHSYCNGRIGRDREPSNSLWLPTAWTAGLQHRLLAGLSGSCCQPSEVFKARKKASFGLNSYTRARRRPYAIGLLDGCIPHPLGHHSPPISATGHLVEVAQ